jgi:hypothetical protein
MKNIFYRFGFVLIFLASACDLDKDLQNPNEVSVTGADVDLLMNGVQLDFADFFNSASTTVAPLVRMTAMTGGFRYQTAIQPQTVDPIWTFAYQNVLVNAETLIPLAQEKKLTTHVAVAKILEAYTYLTLVDIFGDVPQSNALKGPEGEFNPTADPGADVYAHAITLLNEARTELAKGEEEAGAPLTRDIYYEGDRVKWNALANTLELKAWLNISMISIRAEEANARIATLLAEDLVDSEEENFTYKYGTATVPVSRHPLYNQFYGPTEGSAGGYLSNYFMHEVFRGKPDPAAPTDRSKFTQDPRWRYYFYRQVGSIVQANAVDPKSVGCSQGAIPTHYASGNYVFCTFEPGFYGRDHGDASGTPPSGPVITVAGVYPAAGLIDTNPLSNETFHDPTERGDGADGEGIQPIFMSFFTDFMKAEIAARAQDFVAAKDNMTNGILNSIAQVKSFAASRGQTLPVSLEPSTLSYLAAVSYLYDNAARKLDVIGKEYYIASWGNGIEAYNNYRRTGAPRNMQPTLQINPGPFFRRVVYPAAYVNLNNTATQIDVDATNKVFWDTNPDNLN